MTNTFNGLCSSIISPFILQIWFYNVLTCCIFSLLKETHEEDISRLKERIAHLENAVVKNQTSTKGGVSFFTVLFLN